MNGPNRPMPPAPSVPLPNSPITGLNTSDAKSWNVAQVCEWLEQANFAQFTQHFRDHDITGDLLVDLNYALLKEIGIHLVGDRARILATIKRHLRTGGTSIVTDGQSLSPASPKIEERRGPQSTSPNRPHKHRNAFANMSPGSPLDFSEADSNSWVQDGRSLISSSTPKRSNSLSKRQVYPALAPRSSSINKEPKVSINKEPKMSPSSAKSNSGDIHCVKYVSLSMYDC